jgi:hypothetical protein
MHRLIIALLLISATAPVMAKTPPKEDDSTNLKGFLEAVDVSDGISKSEAESIGQAYFYAYVGCGGYTGIREEADHWVMEGAFGIAGEPVEGTISKSTGAVTSPFGPSLKSPVEMLPVPKKPASARHP